MISQKVRKSLEHSSMIRAMFEEGKRLRALYGAENVYDFSLGNPECEPPETVKETIRKYASGEEPGIHKYMENAGYPEVREKIAAHISKETQTPFTGQDIIMSCGAAGGINAVLKAVLNPGEEVLVLAPFFVEYLAYIENHQGVPVIVPPNHPTFQPDVERIAAYITEKTKALILNSPNNPTGAIYSEANLTQLASCIREKEREFGTQIFVVSDEPYTKIVFDDAVVPSIPLLFENAIIVSSYSKSLALPGERIGYVAVSPKCQGKETVLAAVNYCHRVLGYVNAPSMFQKVVADTHGMSVDVKAYQKKRDVLYNCLTKLGFACTLPQGTFYLFPRTPIEDDLVFKDIAAEHHILLVPGTGFGCPGYCRIAYCVDMEMIERSLPAFEALAKTCGL